MIVQTQELRSRTSASLAPTGGAPGRWPLSTASTASVAAGAERSASWQARAAVRIHVVAGDWWRDFVVPCKSRQAWRHVVGLELVRSFEPGDGK